MVFKKGVKSEFAPSSLAKPINNSNHFGACWPHTMFLFVIT
jgi:hypothetical protein